MAKKKEAKAVRKNMVACVNEFELFNICGKRFFGLHHYHKHIIGEDFNHRPYTIVEYFN